MVPTPSWLLMRKRAAVQFGERACDGKAQARALVALRELGLDLLEGTAELVQGVLGNADAVVLDVDVDGIARRTRADRDAAAVAGELGGVLQKVDEDLVDRRARPPAPRCPPAMTSTVMVRFLARICSLTRRRARWIDCVRPGMGRFVRLMRPASMRDMSRMSLITDRRYCAAGADVAAIFLVLLRARARRRCRSASPRRSR